MVYLLAQYDRFYEESLLIQFERLANIYFLVIAILQSISAISPLGPLTAWAPLIVVLGISMLREGIAAAIQATRTTSVTNQTNR